jgi:Family of unknown function (DUF5724)/Domain of unknown function (DUF4132)
MLNPEVAKAQLEQIIDKNWRSQRLQQFAALPEAMAVVGYGLFGLNDRGKSGDYWQSSQFQATALERLERLSEGARTQIFSILFPKISATVELAWQFHSQLPYPMGYSRRSFRTPHHPEFTQAKRGQWLLRLLEAVEGYDQDLEWFAAWVPYLQYYGTPDVLGILFAATINQGDALGQSISQILLDSARGDHEIGAMGRHVTRALLVANDPNGWDFIERLLLAAQRQEGLRQTILETIDEAHPVAFGRMLKLLVVENLTRFSAVIRAIDVWFGFGLESLNEKQAKQILTQVSQYLEDEAARKAALASEDPQTVYLGLWSVGFMDAISAIPLATTLLNHPEATHRFVAVHFLIQLDLPPARLAMLSAIGDRDLTVAAYAIRALQYATPEIQNSDAFERLEENLARFPEKAKRLPPMVWEWVQVEASQGWVAAAMVGQLGTRSPKQLIPIFNLVDDYQRRAIAKLLSEIQPWDAEIRGILLGLLGDKSQWVREDGVRLLHRCTITEPESIQLENLLTRKASDLRRGILGLLLNQTDEMAITAGQRLLQAKQIPQRQAGLELLRELVLGKRLIETSRALAAEYRSDRPKLTTTENQLLEGILEPENEEPTLTNALGLIALTELTPLLVPETSAPVEFQTEASKACIFALDKLVHEHRQTPIKYKNWEGEQEVLLGNVPGRVLNIDPNLSPEENLALLPLADVWENWWQNRPAQLQDKDGLELLRTVIPSLDRLISLRKDLMAGSAHQQNLFQDLFSAYTLALDLPKLRYPIVVTSVVECLLYLHPPKQGIDFVLNAITTILQVIPHEKLQNNSEWSSYTCQTVRQYIRFLAEILILRARHFQSLLPTKWQCYQAQWWQLLRWIDTWITIYQPVTTLYDAYNTYKIGAATEADLIFHLIGIQEQELVIHPEQHSVSLAELKANLRTNFSDLSDLTRRKLQPEYAQDSALIALVDRCRQRILAVELQRGDFPTAASRAACNLRSIAGIPIVIQLIQSLGQDKLVRGYAGGLSKAAVFSHLMRVSFPAPQDTPAEFSKQVAAAQIPTEKLIQFACYAPQWANYVEHALNWTGFADAVWWIHAHTKDTSWSVDQDVRETWAAQISERTPLSTQSLMDGAVDVEWFLRVYKRLKPERWLQLYETAQYASSGIGHQRAKLFADAMLGRSDSKTLRDRITEKRHQDSVRALGLLPLPKGKKRQPEILSRYQFLQEFLRTSKKFGSQRQASEKLCVEIGLENLARTAGFVDPQRLQWAMESAAIADLSRKAQVITLDEVSVSLSINPLGEPEIAITKQDKPLKAIPAKFKKNPEIQAIAARKQDITRQASRMRISLEQAMCRGDRFTAEELIQLTNHAVLAPMLNQLILIGEQEMGYLVEQGTALHQHDGSIQPIQSKTLRIAHPWDLLQTNAWHLWQQDCFSQSRAQPFKQIFRELYVPTAAEQTEKISRRYEGHQVNPRQALALFGTRGWIAAPDEGLRRTFHQEGLTAEVDFLNGFYTPLEVEGLTLARVRFHRRDEWESLPLTEISPALFSEVMRDLDLVVSVAHQGGVDPEATTSTVEMRASLVRETCRLLKLSNVQIQGSHVLIEGYLGSYSIHLGSAMVHRQPGGALCIIPVPSQHRGRIFLPFVDNDPKTAEVVSKVLLLSKDKEIQDPTILEQIL